MVATTLPTSRPVTQDWDQDFQWLTGKYYADGFYASIGWLGHNGIDYGCFEGDPVEAVCDGVIEFAGDGNNHWLLTGGGNAVLLRNDELGIRFEYLHLSGFDVTEGQRVSRGQVIARSGNTGTSTAPHLHIGAIPVRNVDVNNGYRGRIDPTPYLYGPMNPDYAGSGAIAPQGTITPQEEIDVAAEQNIMARLAQIVEWQDSQFREIRDTAERNRNMLAGFVRDVVNAKETITAEQIDAKLAELTAAQEPSGELLFKGDASPEVYAWDAGEGFRHIDQAEYLALVTGGAALRELPQAIIDASVGGK